MIKNQIKDTPSNVAKVVELRNNFEAAQANLEGRTFTSANGRVKATVNADMILEQLDIDADIPQDLADEMITAINHAFILAREGIKQELAFNLDF